MSLIWSYVVMEMLKHAGLVGAIMACFIADHKIITVKVPTGNF